MRREVEIKGGEGKEWGERGATHAMKQERKKPKKGRNHRKNGIEGGRKERRNEGDGRKEEKKKGGVEGR